MKGHIKILNEIDRPGRFLNGVTPVVGFVETIRIELQNEERHIR